MRIVERLEDDQGTPGTEVAERLQATVRNGRVRIDDHRYTINGLVIAVDRADAIMMKDMVASFEGFRVEYVVEKR